MNRDHDRLALTNGERDAFAEIEQALSMSDPAGIRRAGTFRRPAGSGWRAGVLLAVGAIVMVVSFMRSLPVALAGAALFAAGLGIGSLRAQRVVIERLRGKTPSDA